MKRRIHRLKKWLALSIAALLLTGCQSVSLGSRNVEELLRAPQVGTQQAAIQKALSAYLGETPQLKYPRGGQELAPILLDDFDGDDVQEAVVLFSTQGDGQNVRLALLEPSEDGWSVVVDTEGLSTEVAMAERVNVLPGGMQLTVGYANANLADKYLAVYTYCDGALTVAYQQAYDAYYAADFTGSGTTDLVVVPPPTQPGATLLHLVSMRNNGLETVQTVELDTRFVSCTSLMLTRYSGLYGLVVDGALSSGGYASQVLLVRNGRFTDRLPAAPEDIVRTTTRDWQQLTSVDVNDTGIVLVPEVITGVSTLEHARRFYYVQWNNYLVQEPAVQFGVYDAQYGYFVRLPQSWQGLVTIADGTVPEEWQIRAKAGDTLLVSVRMTEDETIPTGFVEVGDLRGEKVLMHISEQCAAIDRQLLRSGVIVLAD